MAKTESSLTIMTEELNEEVLDSLSEIEKLYTVFNGASQEDVAYAKVFWNSLSLQPPIESRLVSADIRQRLKVAKTPHCKRDVHSMYFVHANCLKVRALKTFMNHL